MTRAFFCAVSNMSVAKLMEEFAKREQLPVDLKDIVAAIRARGIQDEITFFHDVEMNPRILSGFLRREEGILNGKPFRISKITYAKMGHEMERVVCCKELLHIADPDQQRVYTREQVDDLISKITLPAELVDAFDDDRAWKDRIAILEAIAVLFPLGARKILYEVYMKEQISIEKIADIAEMPVAYARMVMGGNWPELHRKLIIDRKRIEDESPKAKHERFRRSRKSLA